MRIEFTDRINNRLVILDTLKSFYHIQIPFFEWYFSVFLKNSLNIAVISFERGFSVYFSETDGFLHILGIQYTEGNVSRLLLNFNTMVMKDFLMIACLSISFSKDSSKKKVHFAKWISQFLLMPDKYLLKPVVTSGDIAGEKFLQFDCLRLIQKQEK